MSMPNSSSSPRGKPESLKPNPKIIKFSKLMMNAEPLVPTPMPMPRKTQKCEVAPLPKSLTGAKVATRKNINVNTASVGGAGSLISDPVKVLKKSSPRNLGSMLERKPRREGSYLDQLVKKKSATSSNAATVTTVTTTATAAVATTTNNEPRTTNSSYTAAHDDYDEDYVEVSDASGSKSEDSFLNIVYENNAHKRPRHNRKRASNSNPSNDSIIMESGYKSLNSSTTTPRFSQESNSPMSEDVMAAFTRCRHDLSSNMPQLLETNAVKSSRPSTNHSAKRDSESVTPSATETDDSSEQISNLIINLIGPNSRIGKLILQSCACAGQDTDAIYEEIKQCVQAELQMENKLTSFFKKHSMETASANLARGQFNSLCNLDDSLTFVKDHLTHIRGDLNEFKENCWRAIDSKISHTEFLDTTAVLRAKVTYLEKRLFNQNRVMRQDIRDLREKCNYFENQTGCSIKNFSIWPFIACLGAYSVIKLRRR